MALITYNDEIVRTLLLVCLAIGFVVLMDMVD